VAPATDLRSVFMAVLQDHWGIERGLMTRTVFPDAGNLRAIEGLVRV